MCVECEWPWVGSGVFALHSLAAGKVIQVWAPAHCLLATPTAEAMMYGFQATVEDVAPMVVFARLGLAAVAPVQCRRVLVVPRLEMTAKVFAAGET